MPITMSRRKQSNPKPLKSDSDVDEPMDDSSSTSPTPEHDVDQPTNSITPPTAEMDISSEAGDTDKVARRIEWPVKKGTTLGPFSARIEVVQEEITRENSICVRGSSKSLFSIFILEYYCEEILNQTNIKPASVNGPKAALVYIYKPDKQLYLLTLTDVEEQENLPTVFLEGGQDRHPGSDEVDELLQREVDAVAVHKTNGGALAAAESLQTSSDGANPTSEIGDNTSPNNDPITGIQDTLEVPSVSCQSCGVTFRNPANLSAHQLYYCAARKTTPVPPSTRNRPPRQPSTTRETYAPDQAAMVKETGQPDDLVCILCKARFSNLTNCLSHMIKLHTEQNSQACKCCNFISVDIKLLKEHMLIHVRGSGINPNIFMASQAGHGLVGPLAFHGMKDRRVEEKRKRKKHHQAPSSLSLSPPLDRDNSGTSPPDKDQDANVKSSAARSTERTGNLSPGSTSAEAEPSPSTSEFRRSPTGEHSSALGKAPNELQTKPIGRFLCVECDIYFSSHKNYIAHKQFYCQAHSKERKQSGHVQVPPIPPPSVPLVQCSSCGAVFPSRDKLAVHTLYFCQCRKTGKGISQSSDPVADKSNQHGPSSPRNNPEAGTSDEEKDMANSKNLETKSASSAKPHIKVEELDEDASPTDKEQTSSITGNGDASPNIPPYQAGMSASGLSPGSVLLAPGNVPTYIGRQGNSPVYIVASHVFVTPPGEPGSRAIPPTPYPPFSSVIPGGRDVLFKGEHGAPVLGERPLDLTVRKRKGCEEIVSQGGSASKVIKNEPIDQKSSPSSPTPHLESTPSIPPAFTFQNFPGHVQYKCPGCHIAFNRLESLDIHRQFYCQSEGSSGTQTPVLHTSTSIPVHTTLPALPYYQIITNPSPASGSALVPALATVNLRDNHSALPESKGNEENGSSSKGRTSSSPGEEAMQGISTSTTTSPSQLNAKTEEKESNDKVEGAKSVQQCPAKTPISSQGFDHQESNESIPSTSRIPSGSPKNVVRFPVGQNGEASDPSGHTVPIYMPSVVRYMCPSCGVSFMKLESLSAHQQFYCRASQEVLNSERGSPKGKEIRSVVPPDDIPRTVSVMPRSCSTSSESGLIPMAPRPSSGHSSRKNEPTVLMDTGENIDVGEAVHGQSKCSNGREVLPGADKCDDSGNESRTSSSPEENGHDSATNFDVRGTENEKEKDNPCTVRIKLEKKEDNSSCKLPINDPCTITDNNNVTQVKLEKIEEDSCCSGTENLVPKACRQENGNPESLSIQNGCHSPESTKGAGNCGTPKAVDSTESNPPASPPGGMNGSRHNGAGTTAGATGRPAPVMLKHCRACNISFSSLSTFIAHKKYYCASHHVPKNPVH